ncbi:RagB/SusD family nutrient uptake outer membrane protein [Pontibacter diazotrophicus]|uniref:RagB/SusD family nutrient uptake outer membrane protein n=1 Tax=Pontibacter diazotrophicus TaxID=1400979 RepID=A0A3D8LDP0_9BACT|nr:RagB/SusD family nutrient uptake outer membrane protein [Pontibacter diazotrophicus]RDV15463.1 RagB/SusD family nutrient uptake outer membrane protein [Pontibacter diazotrophicus]
MKRIIIASLVCLSFLGTSCEDLLEEEPLDRLSSKTFYKTLADGNAAVNAIYNPLRTNYGFRYGAQYTAVSDYASGQGFYIPVASYQGYPSSIISVTDGEWAYFYQAINLANIVLKYVPGINASDADKNALLGEARFLRALNYYSLVRGWGGVPIRTSPTEDFSSLGGKRASVAEVYSLIIDDLKYAETALPSSQSLAGKPTMWSAKTMLADVYLTIEDFANARDKADEVISSGVYSLVPVSQAADFEKIFGPDAVTSSEDIFSLKFQRTDDLSFIPQFYAPSNSVYASTGWGTFFGFPTYPLLRDWDRNDLRYDFNLYTSYPNRAGSTSQTSAAQPIRFGKFKDAGYAPGEGNDYPIYRYPDALLIYAEAASMANGEPTSLALERLNMVHRRAYGYTPDAASPVDFSLTGHTAASFRDLVLTERAYEFLCEDGKRWFDLKRTGTLKEVIRNAKNIEVADSHLLFPIPQQEINSNPDLSSADQNPGY